MSNNYNVELNNAGYPEVAAGIVQWHHDRNLINGVTTLDQCGKLLEEFTEVVAAALAKEKGKDVNQEDVYSLLEQMLYKLYSNRRIGTSSYIQSRANMVDGLGDMDVVLLNILEREKITKERASRAALKEISKRKGRIINGTFVKEKDLPENQK